MTVLHVAAAADAAYLPHCAAMLGSVLQNAGGMKVNVHFLHGPSIPPGSVRALTGFVERAGGEMSSHPVPNGAVAGLPAAGRITTEMWYRVLLPDLLPAVDRVLYLDCDCLALASLAPLLELDLSGCYLGAVTNVFEAQHLGRAARLGLDGPGAYFNSGVLLMNLDLMRRDGATAALLDYGRANANSLLWPDQDTLNVVLGHRRLSLAPRWNAMNSVLQFPSSDDVFGAAAVAEARAHPGIRHFEGPSINKPWHYLCDDPLRSLYFGHRRATPWPTVTIDGLTPRNVGRRLLRRGRARGGH
ncbi:MAG: glycosyltransferase family 8 protein [Candidatus Dormibacteraeota bacterium]|nr:glycosyltransferase family 8 protein [Candidatus Dormibacteraeota bacterium]